MSVFIVTNCPDICDRRPAPPAPAQEANEVKTTRAESRGGARGSVVRAGQQRVRQRGEEMLSGPGQSWPRVMFPAKCVTQPSVHCTSPSHPHNTREQITHELHTEK